MALSRAKHGMFIFGNASFIDGASAHLMEMKDCERQRHMWNKVFEVLMKNNQVGDCLRLKCINHENFTDIKKPSDFKHVPEGGCNEPCKVRMDCGHCCPRYCHLYEKTDNDPTGHD